MSARWTWFILAGLLAGSAGGAWLVDRPPEPLSAEAPTDVFSEARARPVLEELAGHIGPRVMGSPGAEQAAAYLEKVLRGIPGAEVEIQATTQTRTHPLVRDMPVGFTVRNVLARLPGKRPGAVLVSTHFDAPPESVGAGDAALCVAAAVEMMRALASDSSREHGVVLVLNGGEELGLLGAAAAVQHPWVRDARVFINLDSVGTRGRAILFQSSPHGLPVLSAYARAAPAPLASVIGQDLARTGVLRSETDFRVYNDEADLPGLGMALFENGYAYHTMRDRVDRVEPGSLQHLGANLLATVRELSQSEQLQAKSSEPAAVYYDVLGRWMLVYGQGTAGVVALVALVLVVLATLIARWRAALPMRTLLAGWGVVALSLLAGVLVPVLIGFALGPGLRSSLRWYASPVLGSLAFASAGLAAASAVHAAWARSTKAPPDAQVLASASGAFLIWALLSIGLTLGLGAGAGYLGTWWAIPGAVGLAVAAWSPRWRLPLLLGACVPGLILTAQAGLRLVEFFAPMGGRLPLELPLDAAFAALVGLLGTLAYLALIPVAHESPGLGRAALVMAGLSVLLLGALVVQEPYSPDRPKRLWLEHQEREGHGALVLSQWDPLPFHLASLSDTQERNLQFGVLPTAGSGPATTLPVPPLRVDIEHLPSEGTRRKVRLRLFGRGGFRTRLLLPRDRVEAWSLSDSLPSDEQKLTAELFAIPADGWPLELELEGSEPVPLEVQEFLSIDTADVARLRAELPPWTDVFAYGVKAEVIPL
ncbi:M28 family peptidase [Hyalangium versicolor]|uniref:M28 family peptidase n=1 Tax=Hyalangium versicolor TaxID=2861190 RepID=UPI001CCEDD18|nr:M28 family peptidase [Hyalangium versicolor]